MAENSHSRTSTKSQPSPLFFNDESHNSCSRHIKIKKKPLFVASKSPTSTTRSIGDDFFNFVKIEVKFKIKLLEIYRESILHRKFLQ